MASTPTQRQVREQSRTLLYEEDPSSVPIGGLSIAAMMRELQQQRQPPRILQRMMDALEDQRSRRMMGWSRPWNKGDINVFRTHLAGRPEDRADQLRVLELLRDPSLCLSGEAMGFVEDLFASLIEMAFVFFHNHDDDNVQYEGLTLSFGRRVEGDRSKRDRIDIILEDRRVDGAVDGQIDRVRIYVCSFDGFRQGVTHGVRRSGEATAEIRAAQRVYEHNVARYHERKDLADRQWGHWSERWITTFGPRRFIPITSSFT